MEELLPPLDIDQIVMLLKAINCEEVDNEYWMETHWYDRSMFY